MTEETKDAKVMQVTVSKSELAALIEKHLRKQGAAPLSIPMSFTDPAHRDLKEIAGPIVVRFEI